MPSYPNQKMKLIYLMKILLERTDETHTLTTQELLSALSEYNITAERKSIYTDLEMLRQYGLDIEMRQTKTFSYFVASRQFELPELKLLVDAVQSSRFITQKKSAELIKKLSSLTSDHQAKQLRRQVLTADMPKAINESVYYSIDAIHPAINNGQKISFKYFDYDLSKSRIYRRSGALYTHTPLALCWNDDNYYLICYSNKYDSFVHYRVDRMSNVSISEEKSDKIDKKRFNVSKHIKQVFGMYSGEVVKARVRFDRSLINTVLDRFGSEVKLNKDGDCFEIEAEVSISPIFLSWITQFGAKAEIISPDSLREAMRNLIEELNSKY
jgi:predicted DNA-binding transcriptional regulator YafY